MMFFEIGPAESINALGIVADDHDVFSTTGKQCDDVGLEGVRVLILVHHDVAIGVVQFIAYARVVTQEFVQIDKKIVVVEKTVFFFALPVYFPYLVDGIFQVSKMWIVFVDDLFYRQPLVDSFAEDGCKCRFAGKGVLVFTRLDFLSDHADEIFHVFTVHDHETRMESDSGSVFTQNRVGE